MILAEKIEKDSIDLGSINTNIVLQETLQEGYNDISSIENAFYNEHAFTDYLQLRSFINDIITTKTWSGLTPAEKDITIETFARGNGVTLNTDNTNKVIYLMGKGNTQTQAIGILNNAYSVFHIKEIEACVKRANSPKVFSVVNKYLSITNASDFIRTTQTLFGLFVTQGIRGVNDGEAGEGLFDFIESTVGTTYEFMGLAQSNYPLNTGTIQDFITELMDILRHGKY